MHSQCEISDQIKSELYRIIGNWGTYTIERFIRKLPLYFEASMD